MCDRTGRCAGNHTPPDSLIKPVVQIHKQHLSQNGQKQVNMNYCIQFPYPKPDIRMFGAFLAMSKGQTLKGTICSYGDSLMFTFSSILADTVVQRAFFRRIVLFYHTFTKRAYLCTI